MNKLIIICFVLVVLLYYIMKDEQARNRQLALSKDLKPGQATEMICVMWPVLPADDIHVHVERLMQMFDNAEHPLAVFVSVVQLKTEKREESTLMDFVSLYEQMCHVTGRSCFSCQIRFHSIECKRCTIGVGKVKCAKLGFENEDFVCFIDPVQTVLLRDWDTVFKSSYIGKSFTKRLAISCVPQSHNDVYGLQFTNDKKKDGVNASIIKLGADCVTNAFAACLFAPSAILKESMLRDYNHILSESYAWTRRLKVLGWNIRTPTKGVAIGPLFSPHKVIGFTP